MIGDQSNAWWTQVVKCLCPSSGRWPERPTTCRPSRSPRVSMPFERALNGKRPQHLDGRVPQQGSYALRAGVDRKVQPERDGDVRAVVSMPFEGALFGKRVILRGSIPRRTGSMPFEHALIRKASRQPRGAAGRVGFYALRAGVDRKPRRRGA